jgi:hypothetical protein
LTLIFDSDDEDSDNQDDEVDTIEQPIKQGEESESFFNDDASKIERGSSAHMTSL